MTVLQSGYFLDIAKSLHRWLGVCMLVGACIANVSQFIGRLATSAPIIQSVATYRMLPQFLSWNPEPFRTPVPAILLQGVLCGIMMNFGFGTLVILGEALLKRALHGTAVAVEKHVDYCCMLPIADTMFKNISLAIEFCAFLAVKFKQPHLHRPYEVPGATAAAICFLRARVELLRAIVLGVVCRREGRGSGRISPTIPAHRLCPLLRWADRYAELLPCSSICVIISVILILILCRLLQWHWR